MYEYIPWYIGLAVSVAVLGTYFINMIHEIRKEESDENFHHPHTSH
ncbi:hypothetical protein ACOJUR_13035 [Alicyclobacillus tolerans]